MMKFHLASIFLVLILYKTAYPQIQGSVYDDACEPLPFANILLMNKSDSTVVSGVMATENGDYSFTVFKPGEYVIGVSMLGFKPIFSKSFRISTSKDHFHNEPLFIEPEYHAIGEISVVAQKPVYELKTDRLVVNVENSITSAGGTALEVLEKSPGIIVDRQNNTISMNGKGGVMVMINGKQNRMPVEAAVQMLGAMNADNVKKIELITTPPSKYDAEGDAGLINIVLKKNENFGTNGSFSIGAGISTREKMLGSFNLNHHSGKMNYFGSYSADFNNTRQNLLSVRSFTESGSLLGSSAESNRKALILFQNVRMGFDYTISSKTVLSVLGSGYIRDWENDALNTVLYTKNQAPVNRSLLTVSELSKWIHGMGNINLSHHFREEETLEANLDFLNYYNNNPSDYTVEKFNSSGLFESGEDIKVSKKTPINILVGTVDYSNQVNPKFKLEAGIKGTFTFFNNDVGVSYFNSGKWMADPELTNNYTMNENISAAYSSVSFSPDKKNSFVAGLRYEYMNSVLNSETEKGIIDLHYGELFPVLNYTGKINKNNTWQFSFNRRIDRPTFNELAPFIIFMSPETFIAGNANLLPAFSNIFKTDYQYRSVILSITYTGTKNAIARFQPVYSEDKTRQFFISKNFDHSQTTSIMLAFPLKMTAWWKMQNNLSWIRNKMETLYESVSLDFERSNYRINSIQSLNLNKRFTAEVSGFYQSRSIWGIYESKPMGRMDLGLQMKFKNENSRLNLSFTDVFKTNIMRNTANVPELNIYTYWRLDFEPRVLRLTFTHNFGNDEIKARKRKTASDEEQKRVGN